MILGHTFSITYGDWSCDGHEKNEKVYYKSNKSVVEVRDAYFAATEKTGYDLANKIFKKYRNNNLTIEQIRELEGIGIKFNFEEEDLELLKAHEQLEDYGLEELEEILFQFLRIGDPELLTETSFNDIEDLFFWGKATNGKQVPSIGYGLFQ